ncbi:7,8-dihydropterin-6-yl-methyl-4-(beta-D-ribofuranosyl)aminobenzene 5'-phosphate synthase [Blastococcus aggregatus]|uniref:7,8-dihydropterin-6-yl-methyl-4-(Beta-D-ribofuranosyl)aminobenzene 5'-phosphate synthase n=1 Tax=Blastococcus aggregatus TaxID=38502 RepID=A0A285UZM2_9ACTN|nr:MBL fold metallo-hydrolase [Blastococcus aggregatus]SOC47279.1 7,8-dihydropterin-6-yl-methyl-4-(beta-D-ribofuranosyl)aminobenzene 5'-phosphate synthase [Blastococcus aggregatus]
MCGGASREAAAAAPRPAVGSAVDPIALEPVDEVVITTLVDNSFDGLLVGTERVRRAAAWSTGVVTAAQFEGGRTIAGLRAEHGFSALVTVRRGVTTTSLLFDTGVSPDGMVENASRLGIDLGAVQGVVLSHGHFDHAGGLAGLARRRSLPMTVHPLIWSRRRLAVPGAEPVELPTLSRRALEGEGFSVIERRQPSLLVDGSVLITGEIDRTTDYENGMPPSHQAWDGVGWQHDPLVLDDQALVVHVRGRGLVVLTGCGHGGAVNTVRHAMRLTGVDRLHALLGGLHLGGPAFEPIIPPTVRALTDLAPDLLAPGHCTGWRAQHALEAALPDAWVASSSGTRYSLAA